MAQQKNPNLKDPVLPYADNHVVGDFNGISNGNVNISWAFFEWYINLITSFSKFYNFFFNNQKYNLTF